MRKNSTVIAVLLFFGLGLLGDLPSHQIQSSVSSEAVSTLMSSQHAKAQTRERGRVAPPNQGINEQYLSIIEKPARDQRCGAFQLFDLPMSQFDGSNFSGFVQRQAYANRLVPVTPTEHGDLSRARVREQRQIFDSRCNATIFLERDELCPLAGDLGCDIAAAALGPQQSFERELVIPNQETFDSFLQWTLVERQRTVAGEFESTGDNAPTYLILYRSVFSKEGEPGNWCGANLRGKLVRPTNAKLSEAHAKSIELLLRETMAEQCPAAQQIKIAFGAHYDSRMSGKPQINDIWGDVDTFANARLEDGKWNVYLHEDWAETQGPSPFSVVLGSLSAGANIDKLATFFQGYNAAEAAVDLAAYQARAERYAREGNLCRMPDDVSWCTVLPSTMVTYGGRVGRTAIYNSSTSFTSTCSGACSGVTGYCDLRTGTQYANAEAAERTNCRAASAAEVDEMLNNARLDASMQSMSYEPNYIEWYNWPFLDQRDSYVTDAEYDMLR